MGVLSYAILRKNNRVSFEMNKEKVIVAAG